MSYKTRRRSARVALCSAALAGLALTSPAQEPEFPADPTVWPNRAGRANSDDWLVANHDRLRRLRPRLLVLNFVNGLPAAQGRAKVDALVAALRESSRYHGFEAPDAPPCLEYEVFKYVDLQDPNPEAGAADGNSSRYPRVPGWKEGVNFQYRRLFEDEFTRHCDVRDPKDRRRLLSLSDLAARGWVHEVWFLAQQKDLGSPYECVEVKQAYDERFRKLKGKSVQAGNGGDPEQPFIGRSLRILFINAERGPGCAMESLGHAVEWTATSGAIPHFTRYFREFAGFDLDRRYGLPFDTFYAVQAGGRPEFLGHPDPTTLTWFHAGREGTVKDYVPIGGSVHFPPNARGHYDQANPAPVLTTIETWRRGGGPGGKDVPKQFTVDRCVKPFDKVAGDCMGAWLVYWRQNMPNADCPARDDDGRPMRNWWPFLFY